MRKGRLQEIIMEEKQKHNLPETVMICHDTIRSRIFNDRPFVAHNERHGGHVSPLSELEPYFCAMIIATAKICLAMTASTAILLINALILNTPHQQKLIPWKQKYAFQSCADDLLGPGYFQGFMSRNKHRLVSKGGHKYELDRSSWTKYQTFKKMYDCIADSMIEAGVAEAYWK